jgi:hypothetical protein
MRLTFIHAGSEQDASYRYRARRPAEALGATINTSDADVYIFAKPHQDNLADVQHLNAIGRLTIMDTCDVHWQRPGIKTMMQEATALTVNTPYMADLVRQQFGREATIIIDPYEYEEVPPHCDGNHLLWYGHPVNGASFNRFSRFMMDYPHEIVTRKQSAEHNVTEWSMEAQRRAFETADIVLMPETAPYKSCNRTVEAVRQGCFVVAEPHPSLRDFPGIWIGNIKEGVAWAIQHPVEARNRTRQAQDYVRESYSLAQTVHAWKTLVTALTSTSVAARNIGRAGAISMPSMALTPQT